MMVQRPTSDPVADRAFARFVGERDPEALGVVFDRLAPRLLLAAAHLVGDRDAAEDLVQQTFLEAIAGGGRFEPGRAVMPWLMTILSRRAANELRRRSRQRVTSEGGSQAVCDGRPGPADAVKVRETFEAVVGALERMPRAQRQVLTLHLLHGLRPVDVARALERPLGTVSAQLSRGLRRLRKLLPPGIAAALVLATDAEVLAAVRGKVLRGLRPVPAAAAAGLGVGLGVEVVKKLAVVAFAVVALGAIAVLGASGFFGAETSTAASRGATRSRSLLAELGSAEDVAPTRADVASRREVVDVEAAARAVPPTSVRFVGQLVARETGAPITGGTVAVEKWFDGQWRQQPDVPPVVHCDTEGRFELTYEAPAGWHHQLRFAAAGRIVEGDTWGPLRQGVVVEVGAVFLEPAIPVRVECVDPAGAPLAGLSVEVWRTDDARYGAPTLVTDAKGGFEHAFRPGAYRLEVEGSGLTPRDGGRFRLAMADTRRRIRVEFEPPDPARSVRLRVAGLRGRPLGRVSVGGETDTGAPWSATSDAQGIAFTRSFPETVAELRVESAELEGPREPLELVEPAARLRVGEGEQTVVVRRAARTAWRLEVTDEAGRPVQRFRYVLARAPSFSLELGEEELHPRGVVEEQVLSGEGLLFVVPSEPRLSRALGERVELPRHGQVTMRLTLPSPCAWSVRVVDQRGEPVAGSLVAVVERYDDSGGVTDLDQAFRGGSRGHASYYTARATTDHEGLAELRTRPRLGDAWLRVTGERHQAARADLPASVGETVDVVVRRGARVEGRIEPREIARDWGPGDARRAEFALRTDAESGLDDHRVRVTLRRPGSRALTVALQDDGRFVFPCVPPGSWKLRVDLRDGGRLDGPSIPELVAGETRHVTVDASGRRAGRLRGTATFDGRPAAHATLGFVGCADDPTAQRASAETDAQGRFEIARIAPGWYVAMLHGTHERERWIVSEPLRITPARVTAVHAVFPQRPLRVRVLDAASRPAASRPVVLVAREPERRILGEAHTDADGIAHFETAAAVPLEVAVFRRGAWLPRWLSEPTVTAVDARVSVSPDRRELTIRLAASSGTAAAVAGRRDRRR